jgi:DNA-directed RNA polymerase subunit RPC12/RpoP
VLAAHLERSAREMNQALKPAERLQTRRGVLAGTICFAMFAMLCVLAVHPLYLYATSSFISRNHYVELMLSTVGLLIASGVIFVIEMFRVRCPQCNCRLLASRRGEAAARLVFRDSKGRNISRAQNFSVVLSKHHIVCLRCGENFDLST